MKLGEDRFLPTPASCIAAFVCLTVAYVNISGCDNAGVVDISDAPSAKSEGEDYQICFSNSTGMWCYLVGVTVTAVSNGPGGGYGGDFHWNVTDPGPPPPQWGGAPPSGGGSTTPDTNPSTTPVSCDTGDPVLDDLDVSGPFEALWLASNPNSSIEYRRERASWIVPDNDGGWELIPWEVDNSSGIDQSCALSFKPGTIPPNTVGYVHTHPIEAGMTVPACAVTVDGIRRELYASYGPTGYNRGGGRQGDAGFIGRHPQLQQNYVLDREGIWKFDRQSRPTKIAACGYDAPDDNV